MEKQYSLKPSELQVIQTLQVSHNNNLSMFLSQICADRLAYTLTDKTQFRVDDGQLFVSERDIEEAVEAKEEVSLPGGSK